MGSFGFLLSSGGVDSGAAETEELPSASPIAQLQDGICKNIFALFCKTTQSRTYIFLEDARKWIWSKLWMLDGIEAGGWTGHWAV